VAPFRHIVNGGHAILDSLHKLLSAVGPERRDLRHLARLMAALSLKHIHP